MSEKLCTLRTKGGGGGKYTETSLWTNPSPTSDFPQTTVTLSDSISNYKYVKIVWKPEKSLATTSSLVIPTEALRLYIDSANNTLGSLASANSSGQSFIRRFVYVSDTSMTFYVPYRINTTGTSNSLDIPIEILGLNELAQGKNGGPMFEIMTGSGGSTTNYSARVATNDDTLVSVDSSQAQSGTVTIKRAAKGKIYFGYCARGTNATRPSFTINNVSYNPQAYDTQTQAGISVSFEANDTIAFSSGRSGSFDVGTLTFIEDA